MVEMRSRRKRRRRKGNLLMLALAEMWCTVYERKVWEVFWLLKKLRAVAEKRWTCGVEL